MGGSRSDEYLSDTFRRRQQRRARLLVGIGTAGISILLYSAYCSMAGHLDTLRLGLLVGGLVVIAVDGLLAVALAGKPAEEMSADEVIEKVGILAEAVTAEWSAEERARQIHYPRLLSVQYDRADPSLMDELTGIADTADLFAFDMNALRGRIEHIAETYRSVPSGRLVILGAPGAGKTTLLIRLLLQLLKSRQIDEPVPVFFSASSWNVETQPALHDYLEVQLMISQPALGQVVAPQTTLARKLLTDRLIIPLIDGFDEMGHAEREIAVHALNSGPGPFVVASQLQRFEEVVESVGTLSRCAVIQLKPLSADEVSEYLQQTAAASRGLAVSEGRPETDPEIVELITKAVAARQALPPKNGSGQKTLFLLRSSRQSRLMVAHARAVDCVR